MAHKYSAYPGLRLRQRSARMTEKKPTSETASSPNRPAVEAFVYLAEGIDVFRTNIQMAL
ncbi:hypothetical protein [secondary endosymbiont of Ctenarytaina eucalypti]|uniref:hypothetical protein n=1 Tax=secondary endosymbiont of Ctenarytaina eucalypti TaxID=1199245 RepID=UPI00135873B2|nr:hypothetical protein [secondary endosymbiont of Ctenarytaina eucalypti]